jgi:hypothetical protein
VASGANGEESTVVTQTPSPGRVLLVALVPGAAVHGFGHLYAGEPATARLLFVSEVVGYAAMFSAGAQGTAALDRSTVRAAAFGAGAALFVGSWLYDVVEAPAVARERRARGSRSLGLKLEVQPAGGRLALALDF